MESTETLHPDEIARLSREAKEHPHRAALSALCDDVLSRQAEGQTLFAGREYVEARAGEHNVERETADSESGNLLSILTRGPSTARERGLVAAFAVLGLEGGLAELDGAERDERVQRFVRHADWLEVATPYTVYAFVDMLCEEPTATAVWAALADAALADQDPTPASRARNAARLSALASAAGAAARRERDRIAQEATDPAVRSLVALLAGEEPAAADEVEAPRLSGRLGRVPTPSFRTVLRWVTGFAVVSWLLAGLGLVVGYRREANLELIDGGVRLRHRTRLLGRVIREGEETYTLAALAGAARRVRYPALPLLVGMLALSVGVLIGGVLLFEGLWSGETVLLVAAAAAVAIGGGLDLGLSVLFPGRRGRVAVDLHVLPRRSIRLRDVNLEQADRFLEVLGRRVARRHA